MNCPVCNVNLLMGERLAVQIDYCPKCRGIWLTNGKLDNLIEKSGSSSAGSSVNSREKNQRRKDDDNDNEGGVRGFLSGIFD
jgi:Zn-finger nucleic acid-binding protein